MTFFPPVSGLLVEWKPVWLLSEIRPDLQILSAVVGLLSVSRSLYDDKKKKKKKSPYKIPLSKPTASLALFI